MLRLAILGLLICFVMPTHACLNDSDIQTYEEEFESEYLRQETSPVEHDAPSGIALVLKSPVFNICCGISLLFVLMFAFRGDLRGFNRV